MLSDEPFVGDDEMFGGSGGGSFAVGAAGGGLGISVAGPVPPIGGSGSALDAAAGGPGGWGGGSGRSFVAGLLWLLTS